jgi:glycerol-1-phosphate dehydrogenase [NAD(P)+]
MVPLPRQVTIPRLLHVGSGCLESVGTLLDEHHFDLGVVLVGSGAGPSRPLADRVVAGLRERGVDVRHHAGLGGRLHEAAALAAGIIEENVTTAIAVGGGRVIDPVKLAAARTGIDLVTVPTTVSNDGISSPVASLAGRDGARASHAAAMPCGIVVDIDAVGGAPPATIRAGAGDLLSNLTACLDWRRAHALGHERFDAYSAMIAEAAARPVLDLPDLGSFASHEVLAHGLLLSGLAMAAAGTSRPCSGAEHLVSHALDARLGAGAALHGEQVALGTLVAAAAHGSPLLDALHRTFTRLGLPTRPEDLGLSRRRVVEAITHAPALRPDRWTILSERLGDPGDAEELVAAAFSAAQPSGRTRPSTRSVAEPSSRWQKRSRNPA